MGDPTGIPTGIRQGQRAVDRAASGSASRFGVASLRKHVYLSNGDNHLIACLTRQRDGAAGPGDHQSLGPGPEAADAGVNLAH